MGLSSSIQFHNQIKRMSWNRISRRSYFITQYQEFQSALGNQPSFSQSLVWKIPMFSDYYRPHSEGMGRVTFSQASVRSHLHLRGYPVPELDWGSTPPPVWMEGTPSQVWMRGYPHPRTGWGDIPGYPPVKTWSGYWLGYPAVQYWMGYPPRSKTGWGTPPVSKMSACYAGAFTQEDFNRL